jgi:hypothetical protein
MWPEILQNLHPFPVALNPAPADIVAAFQQQGWPVAGGLPVRVVALLGSCGTGAYPECPNFPDWHAEQDPEDLEELGRYWWCDFDLIDRTGAASRLRMVFNEGDTDCNDGIWGAVWDRATGARVADLTSSGDSEGTVAVVSEAHAGAYAAHGLPVPVANEAFPASHLPCGELLYATGSELEHLIGVAVRWCSAHR